MQLIMETETVADVKQTTMVDTEPIIQEKLANGVDEIKNGIASDDTESSENDLDLNKAWEEIIDQEKIVENGGSHGAKVDDHESYGKGNEEKHDENIVENNINEPQTEPKINDAQEINPENNVCTTSDKEGTVPDNKNKTEGVVPEHETVNLEIKNDDKSEVLPDKTSEHVDVPVVAEVNGVTNENDSNENNKEGTESIAQGAHSVVKDSEDLVAMNGDINKVDDIPADKTEPQKESAEATDTAATEPENIAMSESSDIGKIPEINENVSIETKTTENSELMEVDINKTNDEGSSANDAPLISENNVIHLPKASVTSVENSSQEEKVTSPDIKSKTEEMAVEISSVPENKSEFAQDKNSEAMEVEEPITDLLPQTEKPNENGNLIDVSKNFDIAVCSMEVDQEPKSDNAAKDNVLETTENTKLMDVDAETIPVSENLNKKIEIDILSEKDSQPETKEVTNVASIPTEVKTSEVTTVSIDETNKELEESPDSSEPITAEISAQVTSTTKKNDDQKYSTAAIDAVNEIMDSDDEREAEKNSTIKAKDTIQEINDTTEKPIEAEPKKRNFLGLANTLDILSDDEESNEKVKEPKKVVTGSADKADSKCINLDEDKATEVAHETKNDGKCISNTLDILSDDEETEHKLEEAKKAADKDDSMCINLDEDKVTEVSDKTKDDAKPVSNTLDIISDDEDTEQKVEESKKTKITTDTDEIKCINLDEDKEATEVSDQIKDDKCISIEDDDDVMLIDEDTPKETVEKEKSPEKEIENEKPETKDLIAEEKKEEDCPKPVEVLADSENEVSSQPKPIIDEKLDVIEKPASPPPKETKPINNKPLMPEKFLKKFKANVAEMSRDELEEFCLLKIVEAVIDRSNLSDISSKLKKLSSNAEEWKKKAQTLTKQNRDLKVVVDTVLEEHQKRAVGVVTPLKITRSVGMQVVMSDLINDKVARRKTIQPIQPVLPPQGQTRAGRSYTPRAAKQVAIPQNIPVPRLVPASNSSPLKTTRQTTQVIKSSPTVVKNSPPVQRVEKRSFTTMQSVTVDLTDDEPAPKQPATAPRNNVRLVSPQQLLAPRAQINAANSPRKVFIPINASSNLRPGQTIMIKPGGPGPRGPRGSMVRMSQAPVRMGRAPGQRHPAPLPEAPKQPQHNMWKALPPEPDLKISKVENGIVISWKIEGYQEDSYEEIASYQLYAYQETSSPPSTLLWKKIGDVKALPLPMACTLTQFMAGFKYYFAVRAVDVKSRIGPFSLPGSILLLNK